jgi:UDP-N-acetyl-D-glucosamine dehydrogenase
MNININEVIDAAATKPFGFVPYYPGPGLGGHCIPIDPFYLTWKAREYNVDAKFIEIAGQVNSMMPEWVLENVSKSLNTIGKNFSTSKILIIGLAYKKNIEDIRESPSIEIFKRLYKLKSKISYHDPYVAKFPKNRNFQINSKSIKLSPANIKKNDLTLILTDHDIINWENIKKNSNLIVDTRNVYKQKSKKIFKS